VRFPRRADPLGDPRSWNVTEAERHAQYPCDDLGFAFDDTYFRATSIAAAPPTAYRWLCQLRVAPYSYDWLDNFGRPSPAELTAGADALAPGQRVMHIFRIASFAPGSSLTIRLGSGSGRALMGDFAGSYAVVPAPGGSRLIAKVLVRYPRGTYGRLLRVLMPHVDLFMFRKQLLTLRRYAERDALRDRPPDGSPGSPGSKETS